MEARAQPIELPGPLSGVQDGDIGDSTTIKVRAARLEACPGTGADAALKGHQVLSVGGGAPVRYHCSPAREHDRPPRQIDASWRGDGLLADLADASLARLRAGETDAVRVVIRRQDTWTPTLADSARGQVTRQCCPGTALDPLLAEDIRRRDGRALDADVRVGGGTPPLRLRRGGVPPPTGDGVFLTTLPPRLGPLQVADRYRVRWEVARRSTRDQSVHRVDPIDAERPWSVQARRQASRVASTIAAVRAHQHQLNTRPHEAGASRTEAPRHRWLWAVHLAVSAQCIAHACELKGTAATRRWDNIAAWLTQAGTDPNWRRRPSVLDQ
jgi:hypothetical protein